MGHLGIDVPDLAAAKAYYDQLMRSLGFEQFLAADDESAIMPAGSKRRTFISFYSSAEQFWSSRQHTGLQHLACGVGATL